MTTPTIPTENTPQTGAQDANPAASQAVPGSASQGTQDVYKLVQDLARRVEAAESVSRSKQSEADKVIAASNKNSRQEIDAMVEKVSRIQGLDEKQSAALRSQLLYEEVQNRVFADERPAAQPASQGSGTESAPQLDELEVVKFFELRTSDPDVARAILEADGNTAMLKKSLATLVVKREQSNAPSTGANAGILTGAPPASPEPNDISKINDPRELYQIAAKNIKRRGAVGVPQ
jgi:hypothetical protein